MAKPFLTIISVLLMIVSAAAQSKVANYSFGEAGTNGYEHFSFWANNSQRTRITYTYGANRKEVVLTYINRNNKNGLPGFSVRFPNQHILYIESKGNQLQVSDSTGKYNKLFTWEYEGPVNGIGTFCDVCAQDETEALKLLQSAYLRK